MKRTLILFLLFSAVARGQKPPEVPRLSGIIELPDFKRAVFELKKDCCSPRQLVLSEGESMWGVKLLSISASQRSVEVTVDGAPGSMTLNLSAKSNRLPTSAPGIELIDASIYSVLELYGQLSGKTLLYWPRLPTAGVSVEGRVDSREGAAKILQAALRDKQVITVTDGEKFTMIAPADQVAGLKPHAPRSGSAAGTISAADQVPPGMISFHGVMIEPVYSIYADLIGADLDRTSTRPTPIQPFIFLYTQSALSKEEAVYAFDTLFGWQGIKMIRGQDGSVRPVKENTK